MTDKIAWEKWRDDEHYVETSNELSTNVVMDDNVSDDDDEEELRMPNVDVTVYPHIVRTPLGDFSVLDHNLPSKNFDCWIGHFNFPITEQVFDILDNHVDGIEVLRVLSKYRIFVGVGRLFRFRDVRSQINKLFLAETIEEIQKDEE